MKNTMMILLSLMNVMCVTNSFEHCVNFTNIFFSFQFFYSFFFFKVELNAFVTKKKVLFFGTKRKNVIEFIPRALVQITLG